MTYVEYGLVFNFTVSKVSLFELNSSHLYLLKNNHLHMSEHFLRRLGTLQVTAFWLVTPHALIYIMGVMYYFQATTSISLVRLSYASPLSSYLIISSGIISTSARFADTCNTGLFLLTDWITILIPNDQPKLFKKWYY